MLTKIFHTGTARSHQAGTCNSAGKVQITSLVYHLMGAVSSIIPNHLADQSHVQLLMRIVVAHPEAKAGHAGHLAVALTYLTHYAHIVLP